ncbi:MAG: hypothetical protein H7141_08585 [Burkholderiales bacterium]|nr:hypothetical protein [Bacteroidia bacterium]
MVFIISCADEKKVKNNVTDKPTQIEWLSGKYFLKASYGNYYENWEKQDSVTYYGLGYFMDSDNEDTLFRQRMKWVQTPDGTFMYFNVKNQNDNKDVEFRLTNQENNVYTFENPFRDYPSIITYKILSDTTINIKMNGFMKGKEKKEDFVITK